MDRSRKEHRLATGRLKKSRKDAPVDGGAVEAGPRAPKPVPPIGPEHRVMENRERIIDLLNPEPAEIVDRELLERELAFGFAGGDTVGIIKGALQRAPVEATDWDASCFEEGLFIPELLETGMKIHLGGLEPEVNKVFLTRLLTHPPRDPAVVDFRRRVLKELVAERGLRGCFEQLFANLYGMRALFEFEIKAYDPDDLQRRLETLGKIRDTLQHMSENFANCQSGLRRINAFARYATTTEGYQRLIELLDYDNHLAAVDLRLRIGADGRIRHFEIMRIAENSKNQFYNSPLGRLSKRIGMVFRGYNFSERELVNRWVDLVFDGVVELLPPLIQLLGEMEFYLSALAFKDLSESKGLSVCFPEMHEVRSSGEGPSSGHAIRGLFNPLLFGQEITPVPCDLSAGKWETITIVTGPNSGGKTRLLQAVAIAQMLAQCGMYAPGLEATLCRGRGLFVSLVQEVRADQREGRLGTELIRIRHLFERSRPGALVVLDELCSGTNPSEGEEIFRLVLSLLKELGPCVFITTHFLQFAARLARETAEDDDLRFLQVELDENECPTFHFVPGVAETSLAQQTAARLGVTREELFALVRKSRDESV